MIDLNNGEITIGNLNVNSFTSLSDFQNSPIGKKSKITVTNNEWITLQIMEEKIIVTLVFNKNRLSEVRFYIDTPIAKNWTDWTIENEKERKITHDNFLLHNIGEPPYKFNWGTVESVQDIKNNESNIILRYIEE